MKKGYRRTKPRYELLYVWRMTEVASRGPSHWHKSTVGTEMSAPLVYQIRIKGHLDETWIDWFSPLVVVNQANGEATLTGEARDQAELAGMLNRIFDLNLTLLAVNRITDPAE